MVVVSVSVVSVDINIVRNKLKQTPADKAPSDTHADVKEFLENATLGSMVVSRPPLSFSLSLYLKTQENLSGDGFLSDSPDFN
jgi:pentose-5-phosphate-3-epimerase